jgi:CubicO group peptidase (beta-lactamase class C family)
MIRSRIGMGYGCSGLAMILLGLFLALIQPACPQTNPEPVKSAAITQALRVVVNNGDAPGMIAAIISHEGILAIGAAGVRKSGTDIPMTINDIVHLGSCTKAMTSAMIATLVAEGKLNWDMMLVEAIPQVINKINPAFQKITLRQLLTHRAGLPQNPVDWDAHAAKEIKERRLAILVDHLGTPPEKPGEFNYSNFGYMVAACMAEQVTGLSWESLMKQRLFDPLGMSSAGFGEPDKRRSTEQPWGHSGFGGKWQPSRSYDPEAIGPAGEVHCTVEDWARFLSIHLAGNRSILEQKYLDKLVEPVGFYASGWGVIDDLPWAKGRVLTHNGSNGIWYATVMVAPGLDRAFVVVTNSRDFSRTGDRCSEMITRLVRLDLNADK